MQSVSVKPITGVLLAIVAVIIWSGNFIVARGVIKQINPVSLAFFRWGSAAIIIAPFVWKDFTIQWPVIRKSLGYFFWVALFGITLFNTFVYVGGHHTTAINLALIGTTSSPVMVILLARVFLKEPMDTLKVLGILLCLTGVVYLLARGDWHNLIGFHFTAGDKWVLLGAFCFAVYNVLVRNNTSGISGMLFLFIIFTIGALLLMPFYFWEQSHSPAIEWNAQLIWIMVFLGLGTSVIAYLFWNIALGVLGAGRTALFGNLIPIFSSIEAALILNEDFTRIHVISMLIVFAGIILANRNVLFPKKVA